jgi:hypothetical protein
MAAQRWDMNTGETKPSSLAAGFKIAETGMPPRPVDQYDASAHGAEEAKESKAQKPNIQREKRVDELV